MPTTLCLAPIGELLDRLLWLARVPCDTMSLEADKAPQLGHYRMSALWKEIGLLNCPFLADSVNDMSQGPRPH